MMRPAFSSTRQAAGFTLLLLLILLSPAMIGKKLLPSREQLYDSMRWESTPLCWIRNQIFEEKGDIDIAIVGSSHITTFLNPSYIQEKLSKKLGRRAVVRTIGWGGAGYDELYFIARDLLAHRRVRMLVFYDENTLTPNARLQTWFRFGEDAALLSGLSRSEQSLFYFAAILGMPRNLVCLLRPNLPAPLLARNNYWRIKFKTDDPATLLGTMRMEKGYATFMSPRFVEFVPHTGVGPEEALVYSPDTRSRFEFSSAPLPAWQAVFASHFADLLNENHVKPLMLYIPTLRETRSPVIQESAPWPEVFGADFTLLGIPPAKMFSGLTEADLHKLYFDSQHLNSNGQDFFTSLITPALLQIYEDSAGR
jgi:hypothetical protein